MRFPPRWLRDSFAINYICTLAILYFVLFPFLLLILRLWFSGNILEAAQ